jgi:hypothetical protein
MAAAVTLALAYTTPYEVAYIATHAGGAGAATVNVDAAGAATADLVTDTVAGTPIRAIVAGDLTAGTATYLNQAAARAAFGLGAATTAQVQGEVLVEGRAAAAAGKHWFCDANVTGGGGNLRFTVGAAVDGTAMIRIKRLHSHGR